MGEYENNDRKMCKSDSHGVVALQRGRVAQRRGRGERGEGVQRTRRERRARRQRRLLAAGRRAARAPELLQTCARAPAS
jgi:hypothetical protein